MGNREIVLIGAGEMGGVFARGLLRHGYPLYPVIRGDSIEQSGQKIIDPQLVVVAVGENDLHPVLEQTPHHWRDRLVLLQNELLPRDWRRHDIDNPTVISVWFEKKPGMEFKEIIPSPIFGPHAETIITALQRLGITAQPLDSHDQLLQELVLKNLYILTTNIAGLVVGGTVGTLWREHQPLARDVATEVVALQQWLTDSTFDLEPLLERMVVAFNGDLDHNCMGRSAPGRLQRALQLATEAGIDAIGRLFHPESLNQPESIVLYAALLSILFKEGLYHYTLRVANRIHSPLLRVNAWHHRSDSLSSVVVLIGAAGTIAGLEYLDAIAAVGVALMIAKAGIELGWEAIQELIDTGLEQERLETIRQHIHQVEGVIAMHRLRTRRAGNKVLVDVHIMVSPRLSVSEGHHIADQVELSLYNDIDDVTDVTVHIDPENDERKKKCHKLPMRSELIERLRPCLQQFPEQTAIRHYTLHYLDGELDLEVWIPLQAVPSIARAQELTVAMGECLTQDPEVKRVRPVFY